jgi:hypothetical protein
MKPCVIHQDPKYARRLARHAIALYATLPYYDIVLQPMGFTEATQAYEQSAVFKQEIQPILQPFFAGEYTTYRCDVKYEE